MKKSSKIIAAAVASIAAIGGISAAASGGSSSKPAGSKHTATASVSDASISVSGGLCEHQLSNSRIIFSVTLANRGGKAGKVDVTPVRQYADATGNDSAWDTLSGVEVAAHSRRTVWTPLHVDPAIGHTLETCAARIDGNDTPLRVSVTY